MAWARRLAWAGGQVEFAPSAGRLERTGAREPAAVMPGGETRQPAELQRQDAVRQPAELQQQDGVQGPAGMARQRAAAPPVAARRQQQAVAERRAELAEWACAQPPGGFRLPDGVQGRDVVQQPDEPRLAFAG